VRRKKSLKAVLLPGSKKENIFPEKNNSLYKKPFSKIQNKMGHRNRVPGLVLAFIAIENV